MQLTKLVSTLLIVIVDQSMAAAGEAAPQVFDVVVYGATPAGVCAAVAARREGATVVIVEPTDFVGGMMSSGLSFSDSNQMARECLLGLFEEFYQRVELKYRADEIELAYSVSDKDQRPWTYEPHVAEAVFNELLRDAAVVLFLEQEIQSIPFHQPHLDARASLRISLRNLRSTSDGQASATFKGRARGILAASIR